MPASFDVKDNTLLCHLSIGLWLQFDQCVQGEVKTGNLLQATELVACICYGCVEYCRAYGMYQPRPYMERDVSEVSVQGSEDSLVPDDKYTFAFPFNLNDHSLQPLNHIPVALS